MCSRYAIASEEDLDAIREIIDEINRREAGNLAPFMMKTGEIRPTDIAPIVAADGARLMKWGFQLPGMRQPVINARSETAAEKALFRNALKSRRVAVPSTGFFEWTHPDGKAAKDKYRFNIPGSEIFYMAGLCCDYDVPGLGVVPHFTIMTTEANASMRPFHNRMPVYIAPSEIRDWIRDGTAAEAFLRRAQPELTARLAEPIKPAGPEQMSLF